MRAALVKAYEDRPLLEEGVSSFRAQSSNLKQLRR